MGNDPSTTTGQVVETREPGASPRAQSAEAVTMLCLRGVSYNILNIFLAQLKSISIL